MHNILRYQNFLFLITLYLLVHTEPKGIVIGVLSIHPPVPHKGEVSVELCLKFYTCYADLVYPNIEKITPGMTIGFSWTFNKITPYEVLVQLLSGIFLPCCPSMTFRFS